MSMVRSLKTGGARPWAWFNSMTLLVASALGGGLSGDARGMDEDWVIENCSRSVVSSGEVVSDCGGAKGHGENVGKLGSGDNREVDGGVQ